MRRTSKGSLLIVAGSLIAISYLSAIAAPATEGTILPELTIASSPEVLQEVYRVRALDCSPAPKIRDLTGFRVRQTPTLPGGIITALHGIAGCSRRTAINSSDEKFRGLEVVRVSIPDDIALLSSPELAATPEKGLRLESVTDWTALSNLEVAGHGYGALGADIRRVSLPNPPQDRISNIAVGGAIEWLRLRGSPDLGLKVAGVLGFIAPGHSGSPLLIDRGSIETVGVIAMIDGGQPGPGGKSWAIPLQTVNWQPGNTPMPNSLTSPNENVLYFFPSADTSDLIRTDTSQATATKPDPVLHAVREEAVGDPNQFMRTAINITPTGQVTARVNIRNERALAGFCGKSGAAFYDAANNLLQVVNAGSQWCVDGKLIPFGSGSTRAETYQGVIDPAVVSRIREIVITQTPGGKDVIGDLVRNKASR